MIINTYEFEIETLKGEIIPVTLRLSMGSQIKLKRRFDGEITTTTLFTAIDDPERFCAVLDEALSFPGNTNTIKNGTELADLMAVNGYLGMAEKQRIITKLACASGIISEKERSALDAKSDEYLKGFAGTEGIPKNA